MLQAAFEIRKSVIVLNAKQDALSGINLTLHAGERLALVGLNGAGKTILILLMCGLYDPTKGCVLLNGKDIRSYNRREYYRIFTAVFQNFDLYPTTIADNVSQEIVCDEERVKDCLIKADLWEKIKTFPDGIYQHIGKEIYDDGVQFSGGETQRLILAKALYKNSPVLILDEPSAALDPLAEEKMYRRYHAITQGKSSVFISHRLAATRFCDRIIMLADGKIVEEGAHDELLAREGRYADLFHVQSRYYKEETVQCRLSAEIINELAGDKRPDVIFSLVVWTLVLTGVLTLLTWFLHHWKMAKRASLDPLAEAQIYENFRYMAEGRTAVYVSHRLSSCRFCERIIVFDGGRIRECGNHETLLLQGGLYATLWQAQAQYYGNPAESQKEKTTVKD